MSSFQHPLNEAQFNKLYQQSIQEPDLFWEMQAKHYLHWTKPWDNLMGGDYSSPPINWFSGGELNICYNAIDRHLKDKANDIAIIWEGNEVSEHLLAINPFMNMFVKWPTYLYLLVLKKVILSAFICHLFQRLFTQCLHVLEFAPYIMSFLEAFHLSLRVNVSKIQKQS